MATTNEAQFEFWQDLAPGWLASEDHTELVSGSFGVAAMERLGLGLGERALDIGCGSGSTTIALASIVGPEGAALGIDIAPAMVDAARRHAVAVGVENATFAVADAQVEDVGDEVFDAAYSRFGVMFFADPSAAFANIRRSLRPDATFAFACWTNLFANEWMFVPGAAAISVTGALPSMPKPGEPGPFSLEDPDHVKALLEEAGFQQIEVTPQSKSIAIPRTEIGSLVKLARRVGPVREALRTADEATTVRIDEAVHAALMERVERDELRLGACALVVSART